MTAAGPTLLLVGLVWVRRAGACNTWGSLWGMHTQQRVDGQQCGAAGGPPAVRPAWQPGPEKAAGSMMP